MQTCPTCGRAVGDGVKFCPGCGSKMPQGNVCPVCGRENREGAAFCSACGAALIGQRPAPQPGTPGKPQSQGKPQGQSQGQPQNRAPHGGPGQPMPGQAMSGQPMPGQQPNRTEPAPGGEKKPKKKMSRGKKAALFGGVGVVLLGIIAVLVLFVFLPMRQVQKVDPNSLYAKGCEVYYLNEKGEEVPLTNQLFTDNSIDNQMMASDGPSLGYYIAISDDGTRIFYPDQAQMDAYGPSLYTRLLSEPADKAVMIDSEVAQFQITSDGKKVTYIRGGDHALYQSDLQKKTRIAADVAAFTGSPDGQTVFYADATGVMYQWTSEGGSKQITDNSAVTMGIATEKMAAYYMQDGALYEYVAGSGGAKQIATDVQKVVWITPDGQVYFTADGTDGATMMDFVEDDLAGGSTLSMPERPEAPKAPSSSDYKDEKAYQKALEQYAKDWEAYNEAMGEWERAMSDYYDQQEAAEKADSARKELESTSAAALMSDLYYYDGTNTSLVAEKVSVSDWSGVDAILTPGLRGSPEGAVGFVTQFDPASTEKLLLSDVLDTYASGSYADVSDVVARSLEADPFSGLTGMVEGGTCTFGSAGLKPVAFSQDGSVAYTAQYDQNNPGNKPALYRTPIENGKLGEPEVISTAAAPLQVLQDGRLVYGIVRDGRQTMDLCVGGANAATIHQYPLTGKEIQGADGKSLAYFSSWDIETESGTLNVWCDGESVTVSSNVQSFQMRADGSVLYLYDFDENAGTGTLGLYQNGTMTVLNHDTNCLIPTADRVLYGDY